MLAKNCLLGLDDDPCFWKRQCKHRQALRLDDEGNEGKELTNPRSKLDEKVTAQTAKAILADRQREGRQNTTQTKLALVSTT